jgi:hypothetical protein
LNHQENTHSGFTHNDSIFTPKNGSTASIEQSNNIQYVSFENSLEDLLNTRKNDELIEPSYDDLIEYGNFLDSVSLSMSPEQINHEIIKNNETLKNDKMSDGEVEVFIKIFYEKTYFYIKSFLAKSFSKIYFTRLNRIVQTIRIVCKYQHIEIDNSFFFGVLEDYTEIINSLHSKYNKHLILCNEIYERFSDDIDLAINVFLVLKFLECVELRKHIKERSYLLIIEFMEMYRYITVIPEILSLGYVLTENPSDKVIIIFQLINLFLSKNKDKIQENKTFIVFLIMKAFSGTSRNKIDFIGALKIQGIIQTQHQNLHFFSWEFGHSQRDNLKNKSYFKRKSNHNLNGKDLLHYNIILRMCIFQHLIFLKFHNKKYIHFEEVKNFYDKIMESSNECYGCQFMEFLKLIQSQSGNSEHFF